MITDTGNHQTWVEQYWDVYGRQSIFTPGGFAGMGFGTYGVLGLKLARPDQPAVCVTSDGSFMMFPGAVATATEYGIPAIWVIMNNYTIGVIRDLQRFYMDGREIGTSFVKQSTGEFWNPDFAKMAEAMGAGGISVEDPADLGSAFETALAAGTPYVIDVKVNRDTAVPLIGTWHFAPIPQAEPTFGKPLRHADVSLYPFTAIVDQERLVQALLINAVNPAVGGVLVEGPSGTGKSTAVRGLAELLPEIEVVADCPFSCDPAEPRARLPARRAGERPARGVAACGGRPSAQRDRGPRRRLRRHRPRAARGSEALEPGLLAEANRGILYVDEINLLDDHLCDVLLDAAALGVNVVEREGVSVSHPARFLLVGTMNPEEGELRPQLADRIGLRVVVEALVDISRRARGDPPSRGVHRRSRRRLRPDGRTRRSELAASDRGRARADAAAGLRPGRALPCDRAVWYGARACRATAPTSRSSSARRRSPPSPDVPTSSRTTCSRRQASPSVTGWRSTRSTPSTGIDERLLRRVLDDALEAESTQKKAPVPATPGSTPR